MLRVGLTGGLGSGKSTIGALLREHGAHVIDADAVGRALMMPGQPLFENIVALFGTTVVGNDGMLDRPRLAEIAFQGGRLRELSALVHPAVVEEQERWMNEVFANDGDAIAVVESALIFEAGRDGTVPDWRKRFDVVVLVTAANDAKLARHLARIGRPDAPAMAARRRDAESRIAAQIPDEEKVALADIVIGNDGSVEELRKSVEAAWVVMTKRARRVDQGALS